MKRTGFVPPDIGCLVFAALPVPDRCGWILLGDYLLAALRSGGCQSWLWLFTDEEPQLRMTIALGGRRVDEEAAGESGGRPGLRYREHGRNAAAER